MAIHKESNPDIRMAAGIWQTYVKSIFEWEPLTEGTEPVHGGCGAVYELHSPLGRPGESFAIADMRGIEYAEPHYHPRDNWEFYIVLQGFAKVAVGHDEHHLHIGDALIIPPERAHYTIPHDFVAAVINKPSFDPANYLPLSESNPDVHYDHDRFLAMTGQA